MAGNRYDVDDILLELRAKKQEDKPVLKREEPRYRVRKADDDEERAVPNGMMRVRPIDPEQPSARRRREQERQQQAHLEQSAAAENPLSPDTANFSLEFTLEEFEDETFVKQEPPRSERGKKAHSRENQPPAAKYDERGNFRVQLEDTDDVPPLKQEPEPDYEMAQITEEQMVPTRKGGEKTRQKKDLGDGWQAWQDSQQEEVFTPQQAQTELAALKKTHVILWVRIGVLLAVLGISIYLAFSLRALPFGELLGLGDNFLLLLPDMMIPETAPRGFIAANLLVGVIGAALCFDVLARGLSSLLSLQATSDSPAALAMVFVMVQCIVLLVFPEQLVPVEANPDLPLVSIYMPIALGVMWFTLLGKTLLHDRVYRNFSMLCSEQKSKTRHAYLQVTDKDYNRGFLRGFGPFMEYLGYSTTTNQVTDFFTNSYTGDYSDNYYRASAPMSIFGGLLVGGITYFLSRNVVTSVNALTATICICAPFSSGIVPNLMLHRVNKWLNKRGAFIAGYETAHALSSRGVLLLDEKELYGENGIILHGMKVFAEKRIDEALLDAASVVLSCDGVMSGVFLNMIGGNTRMLRPVDGILYEDSMGISAWVNKKRVLIGNRELMKNHAVPCPSADFESRYTYDGRQVLYIANSGEISAMFVVSYSPDPRIASQLLKLEKRGLGFLVFTTDPNITQEQITVGFGLRKASVRILPTKLHGEYTRLTDPVDKAPAGCVHSGGIAGMLQLTNAAASVCKSVRVGAILQLIAIIVGYGFMALLAFTQGLDAAVFYNLGLFSLASLVITWIAANFGKS